MNGDQVRTWNVGENIQDSNDCQQRQLKFPWKEKKLRRFYNKMNNPCGRVMKVDGANNKP